MENRTFEALGIEIADARIEKSVIEGHKPAIAKAISKLRKEGDGNVPFPGDDFIGWVKLPETFDKSEVLSIKETAKKIQKQCELFIVIGIGGSYLGARAVIELLGGSQGAPEVRFAGINISSEYHAKLLEEVEARETSICVISKSGTTTEPSIAFAVLKNELIKKYGEAEAMNRIYAITDKSKGVLRQEVREKGYPSYIVPDDIGGRYSVLTAVGLLPIAVAGIDIEGLLEGARDMATSELWEKDAAEYIAARFELMKRGKLVEVFEYYEPQFQFFAEWMKQLFGESEGKQGKGLLPTSLQLSADLHSMGQFLQQGNQIFFETILNTKKPQRDIIIPQGAGEQLEGKSMFAINNAARKGVIAAHGEAGIPILQVFMPEFTPVHTGQLIYFFEMTCAVTGLLMDINPFDQPGVESYKAEMHKEVKRIEKGAYSAPTR